jgi:uncharacterized protein YkwD
VVELERREAAIFVNHTVRIALCTAATVIPVASSAPQSDYLTRLERDIVAEHNLARSDPASYAAYLHELKPRYDGQRFLESDSVVRMTQEGSAAVDEAIRFLESTAPLAFVHASRGMSLGARDLVADQGPSGSTGHVGTDGSQPWDRVARYGDWEGEIAENVAYGFDSAREVVVQLIVDDGVRGRGHRVNIFNPEFRVVGVSCGNHARYGTVCVITYSVGYVEKH